MEASPASNDGVEFPNEVFLFQHRMVFDNLADFGNNRFVILLGWFNEQFVFIHSDIAS